MPPVMMMKVIGSAIRPISLMKRPWFEEVVDGEKAVVERAEADKRDHQDDREQRLVPLEPARGAKDAGLDAHAHRFHPWAARRWRRRMSAMTVARMSAPRKASVQ